MTTSNHMLAGTLIALTVKEPVLVIPLAFLSHFVLDALPHHGYDRGGYGAALKHNTTYVMEVLGLFGLLLLITSGVFGWNLALLAALLAVLPDVEWPYRYIFFERKGLVPPSTFLTNFHSKIQWCERKWGIFPEILFFSIGFLLLLTQLN